MNLIERAHENARAKGFWNHESPESFPAKSALIATEVREFEHEHDPVKALEEIADIVIRGFDLLGSLGESAGAMGGRFETSAAATRISDYELCDRLYRLCADAVIAHRSCFSVSATYCLYALIQECVDYCTHVYGVSALEDAVLAKMDINESREYLHGRPY